jgi:hypothetical protein
MPRVGFEPPTPMFERAKTVHPLDRASAVIGRDISYSFLNVVSVLKLYHKNYYTLKA